MTDSTVQRLITRYARPAVSARYWWEVEKEQIERFLAPQIPTLIYSKYFQGKRGLGRKDMRFFDKINAQFICLTCSALYHCLSMYCGNGSMEEKEFRRDTSIGKASYCLFMVCGRWLVASNLSQADKHVERDEPGKSDDNTRPDQEQYIGDGMNN